jgi:hypothetical protein
LKAKCVRCYFWEQAILISREMRVCFVSGFQPNPTSQVRSLNKFSTHHINCKCSPTVTGRSCHNPQLGSQTSILFLNYLSQTLDKTILQRKEGPEKHAVLYISLMVSCGPCSNPTRTRRVCVLPGPHQDPGSFRCLKVQHRKCKRFKLEAMKPTNFK